MIDLRSDTVTKPTDEMRKAMAEADVGDDVYKEDPTVNRLEELAASILEKEGALFIPSGTMGNQVALMTHTKRGGEVILESESHIFYYEAGASAVLSGVQVRLVKGEKGVMDPDDIKNAIREKNIHYPETQLICIENTHNRGGGKIIPLDNMKTIYEIAKNYNIGVHLDGARIFNAAVASGIKASEYAKYANSAMFCLSKGLASPVGSLLVSDKEFIERARKYRKMLGGGMRQAGILAAAGIISLTKMIDRLEEDHKNAKFLARELSLSGYGIKEEDVETNILIVDILNTKLTAQDFVLKLKEKGILASPRSSKTIRLVTHKDVSREDCKRAAEVFKELS